jgi:hypothetical protein
MLDQGKNRYSTPRFSVLSSGVTSTARACPMIVTGGLQFDMQGFGFQKAGLLGFLIQRLDAAGSRHSNSTVSGL